jgi:hypothetical protein
MNLTVNRKSDSFIIDFQRLMTFFCFDAVTASYLPEKFENFFGHLLLIFPLVGEIHSLLRKVRGALRKKFNGGSLSVKGKSATIAIYSHSKEKQKPAANYQ